MHTGGQHCKVRYSSGPPPELLNCRGHGQARSISGSVHPPEGLPGSCSRAHGMSSSRRGGRGGGGLEGLYPGSHPPLIRKVWAWVTSHRDLCSSAVGSNHGPKQQHRRPGRIRMGVPLIVIFTFNCLVWSESASETT